VDGTVGPEQLKSVSDEVIQVGHEEAPVAQMDADGALGGTSVAILAAKRFVHR